MWYRGNANNLINTFLKNRIQQVRVNDSLSDNIILNNGILQGNVLSNLLFIVYINDLLSINCNRSIFSFAADTSIITDDINKNIIHNKSTRVSIVKTWSNNNLLELNLTQTCFINFNI